MTWHFVVGALILAVPVGGWLFFAIRHHKKTEQPKPTPWADSTKVAQEVREQQKRR
jgi:hypothetical protein